MLPVGEWVTEFEMSQLPQGRVVRKPQIQKGKTFYVDAFEPQYFLARASCGAIVYTHMLQNGRLHFFATGQKPTAVFFIPEFEG